MLIVRVLAFAFISRWAMRRNGDFTDSSQVDEWTRSSTNSSFRFSNNGMVCVSSRMSLAEASKDSKFQLSPSNTLKHDLFVLVVHRVQYQ